MKRVFRVLATAVAIMAVAAVVFVRPNKPQWPPAKAGALTNLVVSVTDSAKSATTTYTVSFTNATAIPASTGRINVQIYGAYWDANFNNATVADGTAPSTINILSRNYNGVTVYPNENIVAGSSLTLKIGNVVNPSRGGYYFAHVWTSDYSTDLDGSGNWGGDYNSSAFAIGSNTNVTGTITDSDGTTAVPFTYVYLNSSDYRSYYYGYADKNGLYGFGDVPVGTYTFNIYPPSTYGTGKSYFPPNASTITVAASGTITKNASFLATTKTLSGQVTIGSSGAAVTDATISLWRVSGSGWASANADSNGNYSFSLPGGAWGMNIYPRNYPGDWTYAYSNENIAFIEDATTEVKTKNFTVDALNSTVSGLIVKPDGTSLGQYSVGLSLSNAKNQWFSASVASDGSFTVKVSASSYSLSGWVSDNNYSFPKIDNFTVGDNETKNLGTITLVEKTDVISGRVIDNFGDGVANASISAWKNNGTWDWSNATTDISGNYTLKVIPGVWQVSAWPQWKEGGYDHIYSGKPLAVTVTSGVTATQNFTFQKATATITGTVVDPDGNVIGSLSSWVSASDGSQEWSNIGTSVNNGVFTLKVPAGTWDVNVYLWSTDYGTSEPTRVTIADYESKAIAIATVRNDATITGTVYDDAGTAVTGKWLSIYATKGRYGTWQSASFDQATGVYTIKVAAGTWNLGWWIDSNLGLSSGSGQDVKLTIGAQETKTYDINLKRVDSTISGKATKADGTAMQWAWITADSRDPNEKRSADTYYYNNGTSSNTNGDYTLRLPAGTYWVGANMWPGSGYINPKRQKVTIDAANPATVDLQFRQANATITGTVKKEGQGISAFISAWSEDGGYSEANSNNQGNYTLSVSSGSKWHVAAVQEVGQDVWKSIDWIVDLTDSATASQDLDLIKQNFTMPQAVSTTFDPSKQNIISLDDGTTLSIPANSISTSATTVTLTAQPTAILAEQDDAKPVAYGYEFNVTDENSQEITSFNSDITIESKYEDIWLSDNKVNDENELTFGYYDESTGSWRELDSCTVNEDSNSVTCQVDHFTKFAIVAATDTTPPAAPTNQTATASDGKATLNWTNPTDTDFASVKIYRSTTSSSLGATVHSGLTGTSKEDTGLTNGTTYYYTLRAVDNSGNESTNTVQISATPSAAASITTTTTLPKTGVIAGAWQWEIERLIFTSQTSPRR